MRYYAAILTGAMAQIASIVYMWLYTEMDVIDMLFWSLVIYLIGLAVFWGVTEPRTIQKKNLQVYIYRNKENSEKTSGNDVIFIETNAIRKIERKARHMQEHLSTHFMGVHYQDCLEELGLWEENNDRN